MVVCPFGRVVVVDVVGVWGCDSGVVVGIVDVGYVVVGCAAGVGVVDIVITRYYVDGVGVAAVVLVVVLLALALMLMLAL